MKYGSTRSARSTSIARVPAKCASRFRASRRYRPKTLAPRNPLLRRRDGVHDAGGEERLGHLQLGAHAAAVGERARGRRARAQGVGVALGGPGAGAALGAAVSAPLGARHALAVVRARAAAARAAPRRARGRR